MQQGGEIIQTSNQLPIGHMVNVTQPFRTVVSDILVHGEKDYYNGRSSNLDIIASSEIQEISSDIMEITDDEGDQKEAEDVVDGDEDTEYKEKQEDEEFLYSSAVIRYKAVYVLDPQSTAIAMQDFDTKRKKLNDSKAVMVTKVMKYYKKQQIDLFACSCDGLRSRNVFNSSMELFCCLQDFNNLYPPCLHIRVLEKIKSMMPITELQQQSPDNCGYCAYDNDKEIFCLTKLLFGKQLYAISSVECTYGIIEVECGDFKCLICKGPDCQHVKCLHNHVRNMDIDAAGIPEIMKQIYLQLFSVREEDARMSPECKDTVYFHLSNGQTTVVGSSSSLEGLKLPAEKKRKKRVAQADARRFHCDNCHKSFKHKHHLREHMHLHTGEQPFECKNCGRKFSHSGSLSQHRQRSCNSGVQCHSRQRSSSSKNNSTRKSTSPRSNTNEIRIDEDTKNLQQENVVSPQVTKSKKVSSPRSSYNDRKSVEERSNFISRRTDEERSNFTERRSNQEIADVHADMFSSQIKEQPTYSAYISAESVTVPEPVLYKTVIKSHDMHVILTSSDETVDKSKYLRLESPKGDNSEGSRLVKHVEDSFIQCSSDIIDKIYCEQSFGEKGEKCNDQTDSGDHTCMVCQKKFASGENLHIHMRLHTGDAPYWCDICNKGYSQNVQLQLHIKSEEHQRNLAENLQNCPSSTESPFRSVLSVQSEQSEPTELSFSKPVLSQMLNTPSWDMNATSLPSISELMSSVTTHTLWNLKKEPMSLQSAEVISDKTLMSSASASSYSSGLQLMSSVPEEILQNTPKGLLYDPNTPSLSNGKLSNMQMELGQGQPGQGQPGQGQPDLSHVSSATMTNSSPKSPVSSHVSQSSIDVQSQPPYLHQTQSTLSQHSPGQAAPSTSYGEFPVLNQVSDTNQDSALKALCSFTEKPIPSGAAESLAGVTGGDGNTFVEQKNSPSDPSPAYLYPPSWNGWNNWNGGYPVYGAGQLTQWNGTFGIPLVAPWHGYPNYNPGGSAIIQQNTTGSQQNSGMPVNTEQKIQNKNVPQPKPPAKPKAPYSRYSIKVWNSVKSSNPNLSVGEMNRLIGQMWRGLPEEEKNQFLEDYSAEKEKYKVEYEKFRSSPEFQIWLASNIDKNSNSKKRPYESETEQLEDRQDYRQFIVKAT